MTQSTSFTYRDTQIDPGGFSFQGDFRNATINYQGQSQDDRCLADLRGAATKGADPELDKKRIEEDKGGLLKVSYRWILDDTNFHKWKNDTNSQLLWIKGDPGKGKTMLLCGIINELGGTTVSRLNIAYFFCQAGDQRLNNATATLRGLIYMLVTQQRALLHHVRKKYDHAGIHLFEDINSWVAMAEILANILCDPSLQTTYLIVDALDECTMNRRKLLDFIVQNSSASSVKWIVSSRNWTDIESQLDLIQGGLRLSLELNAESVSDAVEKYIEQKVDRLGRDNGYTQDTKSSVQKYLLLNARGTFLWVALVCDLVKKTSDWHVLKKLERFPPGLNELYSQMIKQVLEQEDDVELCKKVLAMVTIAYQPVTLDELVSFIEPLNVEILREIIGLCGSFLTIRERTIDLIHQSARDFLGNDGRDIIFPSGKGVIHHRLFSHSRRVMSQTLKRDIYNLRCPGILIEKVLQPDPDPLATVRYSCLFWVDHLLDSHTADTGCDNVQDVLSVDQFLREAFLYWLEALSLMRSLSSGVLMIRKLEDWVTGKDSPILHDFIHDARRFAVSNRSIIEQAPLQTYCSALVFAPEKSIIRKTFKDYIPSWIQRKPKVETYWNATLQILEGHTDSVNSVAFSPDGKQIVSGSNDKTVRLWDTATGELLQTLEGHTHWVNSVAFSPNGKQVVSGSYDKTIRLWDTTTGESLQTLEGHTHSVKSVAFSPDSKQVVSGFDDKTVRLWDTATGELLQTLEGYSHWVRSVAFSPDGTQVVSGSNDKTVRLWDTATGELLQTLEGHTYLVNSVAFSPNGKQVVSGSYDNTIRLWDATIGAALQTLKGHSGKVSSIAFSPDGKQVVSGSHDKTIRLWDAITEAALQTLKGHSARVSSIAFSPNGKQVVSGSYDKTVRLWDTATEASLQTLKGHSGRVWSIAFSPNGTQVVSGSYDKTVRLWDATTGAALQTLEGHSGGVSLVAFSPDGTQVVSGSYDKTVRLWDATTGAALQTLEGHSGGVWSVAFSRDGTQVVSGSYDKTVRLWDATTGAALQTLEGHSGRVWSVAFSPDGTQVVSGSHDKTVRLWDATTGAALQTLEGHSGRVWSVAFSRDGTQVVSGSHDKTVRLWDATTGAALQTLEGHSGRVSSIAFSPDGTLTTNLCILNEWVCEGHENILWLPPDYRSTCEVVWDKRVVIGHLSGRISFLQIQQGVKLTI